MLIGTALSIAGVGLTLVAMELEQLRRELRQLSGRVDVIENPPVRLSRRRP